MGDGNPEGQKVLKVLFYKRTGAVHDMCILTACVLGMKKMYGRYSAYDRRSRCILSEHQRITALPQSKPRRRLQNKSLPHTPIAGWFLLKCWPGDWVVFYLAASIGFLQGFPVNRVWIKSTFRLPSGSIA